VGGSIGHFSVLRRVTHDRSEWASLAERRGANACASTGSNDQAAKRKPADRRLGGPLPRALVASSQLETRRGWRLGWSRGGGAEPVGTTQAARSDHPCRGPGRSRSPIQPIRGPARIEPTTDGPARGSAAQKKRPRVQWAGGSGPARPQAGWIVGAASRWGGWPFADRGRHGLTEQRLASSRVLRIDSLRNLAIRGGVKAHGRRGADLSICMLQKPNHDHGCYRRQPETRAAGTEGHPWRLPARASSPTQD
jgi:hypothetical protein